MAEIGDANGQGGGYHYRPISIRDGAKLLIPISMDIVASPLKVQVRLGTYSGVLRWGYQRFAGASVRMYGSRRSASETKLRIREGCINCRPFVNDWIMITL